MIVTTFVQTPFAQNTRIIACSETKEAICIDPGEDSPEVIECIEDNEFDLKAICITHGHLDHTGGTSYLHKKYPDAEVLAYKDEEDLYYSLPQQPRMLGLAPEQLTVFGFDFAMPPRLTRSLSHGEMLAIGKLSFEVRHCPGHTLGHIVLVEHEHRAVFTGDCLFSGTIGRTDLPGGNHMQLIDSIRKNILSLDDEFEVHCGHGPNTSVHRERRNNPFLAH